MSSPDFGFPQFPLSRRSAVKHMFALSIALSTVDLTDAWAGSGPIPTLGRDPNLHRKVIAWPLTLTDLEKDVVNALSDLIIPEDDDTLPPTSVGVPEFIDEWVSAPYGQQQRERKVICEGLAWIEREAQTRFHKGFAEIEEPQQLAILEDIVAPNTEARKHANAFFRLFRDRVAGAYFSTSEGWKAIGYVGNSPMQEFPGPPPEVLNHLGLL